jgi:hypothetical protein
MPKVLPQVGCKFVSIETIRPQSEEHAGTELHCAPTCASTQNCPFYAAHLSYASLLRPNSVVAEEQAYGECCHQFPVPYDANLRDTDVAPRQFWWSSFFGSAYDALDGSLQSNAEDLAAAHSANFDEP